MRVSSAAPAVPVTTAVVAPSLANLRRHVRALVFPAVHGDAVVARACVAAGVADEDPVPPEALARVADVLRQQDGVARVIGRSLAIRIATYLVLRKRAVPGPTDASPAASSILSAPASA